MAQIERLQGREPLREAYKFFSSDFLEAVSEGGSVRIGTSASFRIQDGYEDGRADPHEMVTRWRPGAARVTTNHPAFRSIGNSNLSPELSNIEIPIIIEEGATFFFATDAYILCLSDTPDDVLFKGMMEKFRYDMFYHIPDIEAYVAMLINADKRLQLGGECAHVTYDAPEDAECEWRPCLFRKRQAFDWQREIRVIWKGEAPLEPFTVELPDLSKLISISRNPAAQT